MQAEIKIKKNIYRPYLDVLSEKIKESYLEEVVIKNMSLYSYKSGLLLNRIFRDLAAKKCFNTNDEFYSYIESLNTVDSINSGLITLTDVINNEIASAVYPKLPIKYWFKEEKDEVVVYVVES